MKSAIGSVPGKISELMANHLVDIADAWANCGETPLKMSFPVEIGFKNNRGYCKVGIKFSKEKVDDSLTFEWDDKQAVMPFRKEAAQ